MQVMRYIWMNNSYVVLYLYNVTHSGLKVMSQCLVNMWYMDIVCTCDAIKQNESELERKSRLQNCIVCLSLWAIFCWKHHQIWTYGSRVVAILVLIKTINYKRNWKLLLANILKINISEFRLILLDHIT